MNEAEAVVAAVATDVMAMEEAETSLVKAMHLLQLSDNLVA